MIVPGSVSRIARTSVLALALSALTLSRADAARIREFSAGTEPYGITVTPDGSVRFVQSDTSNVLYENGPGQAVTILGAGFIQSIAAGPSWLWLLDTGGNQIFRYGLVVGSPVPYPVPTAAAGLTSGAVGADGNLWFTEFNANKIGRVTPAGGFVEYPIPTPGSGPFQIVACEDGRLYFTEKLGNKLGRISTTGVIEEFPLPTAGAEPAGLATGGYNVAVVESKTNKLAYFNLSTSTFDEFTIPTAGSQPWGIAWAGSGKFFVTLRGVNRIGIVSNASWKEVDIPTPNSNPSEIVVDHKGRGIFSEHASKKLGILELSVPGDVNADGKVDVADVFFLINFVFADGASPQ